MTSVTLPSPDTHVRLLAGHAGNGRPAYEVLPARTLDGDLFELAGSPGLVLGCGAGDVLRISDDGEFEVTRQGPWLCVQAAPEAGTFSPQALTALHEAVEGLGGLVESPATLRFAVITIARATDPAALENALDAWADRTGQVAWWFGNGEVAR
ncbi:DUF4265 domain-containing protein [Streptomyces sp. NPDC057690]|uniref:DUF4265 domain-containing protein n=1 Tax=Streptomyces sp. NPDC057690 TaxID=3346214 RepID=UPI0036820650